MLEISLDFILWFWYLPLYFSLPTVYVLVTIILEVFVIIDYTQHVYVHRKFNLGTEMIIVLTWPVILILAIIQYLSMTWVGTIYKSIFCGPNKNKMDKKGEIASIYKVSVLDIDVLIIYFKMPTSLIGYGWTYFNQYYPSYNGNVEMVLPKRMKATTKYSKTIKEVNSNEYILYSSLKDSKYTESDIIMEVGKKLKTLSPVYHNPEVIRHNLSVMSQYTLLNVVS